MIRIENIVILAFLVLPLAGLGQTLEESIEKAYTYQTAGNHERAASIIDKAIETNKGAKSEIAWHIRGFVYKDLFLKTRSEDVGAAQMYREEAVSSLQKSMSFDRDDNMIDQNRKALKYLAVSYFNDASDTIKVHNPKTIDSANLLFENYKSIVKEIHPDTVLTDKEIEYYLAMSTAHRKIYEMDREKYDKHWYRSNEFMDKVLNLDPESFKANYSKGVSYYNRGAYNLERLPSVDILDLMQIQSESMRSIESALPFMLKAYEIDPTKIEAVKGLKIIFFNLNKEEESKYYDNVLEKLKND